MKKIGLFFLILCVVISLMILPVSATGETEEEDTLCSSAYKVGDIIKFGHYEQDGDKTNGKEEIEWQVLKVEPDRVLVISKYALDCLPFHEDAKDINLTWETCSLRKWLNGDFMDEAFSLSEKEKIPIVNIETQRNPFWGVTGGNNTKDQLFCLDIEDLEDCFGKYSYYESAQKDGYNQKMICTPTPYAIENGAVTSSISEKYFFIYKSKGYTEDVIGQTGTVWWLRNRGALNNSRREICYVSSSGSACGRYGKVADNDEIAVRPAMYIQTAVFPTRISLNKNNVNMYFGEELLLLATLLPENVTEKKINWSVSNPQIASVNNGLVKVWGAGNVKVTAETVNGYSATCDILVLAENNPSNPFADVKSGNWKYNAALYAYENGYMNGKGTLAGKILFSPDTAINRSQFVQTLYNVEGKPPVTYEPKFTDVDEDAWYAKPVTWAEQNGIVAGNANGTFGVNGTATREQLAQMFYKYAKYKGYNVDVVSESGKRVSDFPDSDKVSNWAENPLNWALSRGIMSGKGSGKLDPKGSATRAECATMLRNFMNAYKNAELILSSEEIREEESDINSAEPDIIDEKDLQNNNEKASTEIEYGD